MKGTSRAKIQQRIEVLPPTPARVRIMSAIKSRGNLTTELALARLFRKKAIKGWRRNIRVIGSPDFVFPKKKLAIFVDGCFWHGCPKCYKSPSRNSAFWLAKVTSNRRRDRRVTRQLRKLGWKVIRIWEHDLVAGRDPIPRIKKSLGV